MLIACPLCSCHAFARETHCPSCGALLRASDGSLQRTAGAALLGLTIAFTVTVGCSGEGSSMSGYQTMSTHGTAASSSDDSVSTGPFSASSGGMGGSQPMSTTGTAASSGNGGAGGAGGARGSK